jgi:hypothetical protein
MIEIYYLVTIIAAFSVVQSIFGAGILCSMFGGGRRGAAGINNLPKQEKNRFIEEFINQFSVN